MVTKIERTIGGGMGRAKQIKSRTKKGALSELGAFGMLVQSDAKVERSIQRNMVKIGKKKRGQKRAKSRGAIPY